MTHSRERNERAGISGLLLHRGGNFLQVVEGPSDAVRDLTRRLERDPRHRQFTPLLALDVADRLFPDWSMGFEQIDAVLPPSWPGLSRFLQEVPPPSGARTGERAPALYFFEVFRTHMR